MGHYAHDLRAGQWLWLARLREVSSALARIEASATRREVLLRVNELP